ncbi:uncharacterized protein LOC143024391 [Oratosquilla oratoria]|uniref:uncharacterized protein LOC143024391 n=1 Tax=Oratosquilla oratoria TaxID=337810 RepID=UPI003F777DBA
MKTTSRVQVAEVRVLRMICGVARKDRLRNETIRRELDVESIFNYVARTQLRWYGHVGRMEEDRTPRRWYHWVPNSGRPQGRSRKRWGQNVDEALRERGTSLDDVRAPETFLDRENWRRLVADGRWVRK